MGRQGFHNIARAYFIKKKEAASVEAEMDEQLSMIVGFASEIL
jgi:hypothetical protein